MKAVIIPVIFNFLLLSQSVLAEKQFFIVLASEAEDESLIQNSTEASARCEAENGKLAEILNEIDQNNVSNLVGTNSTDEQDKRFWIAKRYNQKPRSRLNVSKYNAGRGPKSTAMTMELQNQTKTAIICEKTLPDEETPIYLNQQVILMSLGQLGGVLLITIIFFSLHLLQNRTKNSDVDELALLDQNADEYEISWENVYMTPFILGEGAFGRVVRGKLNYSGKAVDVAVKVLKAEKSPSELVEAAENLRREIEFMRNLQKNCGVHKNLVTMLACVTDSPEISRLALISEYCPFGSLLDFLTNLKNNKPEYLANLREKRRAEMDNENYYYVYIFSNNKPAMSEDSGNATQIDTSHVDEKTDTTLSKRKEVVEELLLLFAHQICSAMEHLSRHNHVHRDLAARNVFVYDFDQVKIGDFGLSRHMDVDAIYRRSTKGGLPIKWTAPEAIEKQLFTTASDVWSYGVVLWEIATYGEVPYPNVQNQKMFELLLSGERLPRPETLPELYPIMTECCWQFEPDKRKNFGELLKELEKFCRKEKIAARSHQKNDVESELYQAPN